MKVFRRTVVNYLVKCKEDQSLTITNYNYCKRNNYVPISATSPGDYKSFLLTFMFQHTNKRKRMQVDY